MLSYRDFQDKF